MCSRTFLYNYIYDFQFSPELLRIPEVDYMKERYYKGICVKFKIQNSKQFCRTELLTFTEATIIAPLTIIVTTFFPTFAYLTYCCIKFYGWKNWVSGVLDNPTYYIFSIFTNISFYESTEPGTFSTLSSSTHKNSSNCFWNKNPHLKENLKKSLIDIPTLIIHHSASESSNSSFSEGIVDGVEQENEIDVYEDDETLKKEDSSKGKTTSEEVGNVGNDQRSPTFSFYQSNILYILFLLGFASCIILDVLVQFGRKGWRIKSISSITRWAVAILLINVVLWVDFMIGTTKRKKVLEPNNQESSWLNDLISFSSNSLVCVFLLPFFLCRKIFVR